MCAFIGTRSALCSQVSDQDLSCREPLWSLLILQNKNYQRLNLVFTDAIVHRQMSNLLCYINFNTQWGWQCLILWVQSKKPLKSERVLQSTLPWQLYPNLMGKYRWQSYPLSFECWLAPLARRVSWWLWCFLARSGRYWEDGRLRVWIDRTGLQNGLVPDWKVEAKAILSWSESSCPCDCRSLQRACMDSFSTWAGLGRFTVRIPD